MQRFILSLLLLLTISFANSQVLQPCRITSPDQITMLLPNYTGSVQPCSYSGFAPLDKNADNALFYWYFPNQMNNPDAPVLLWLQGGPGASSMFGALVEKLSPFSVVPNTNGGSSVIYNDEYGGQTWAYYYNVLFFDNPVGTGFSYTANGAYPTNMDEVSDNLWTALQYFVSIHPETLSVDWHFTGESHAGRYIPAFSYYTLKYNDEISAGTRQGMNIPLKSIMVGDGYVHGVQQRITEIGVGRSASLLAPYQYPMVKALAVNCQNLAATEGTKSLSAVNKCNEIPDFMGDVSGIDCYAVEISANETAILSSIEDAYLNNQDVYKALHVTGSKKQGPLFTDSDVGSTNALLPDVLNNSIIFINSVLSQIPSMYFAGNFDARDGSYGVYQWIELLGEPYTAILNQTRNIWYLNGEPVGFWMEWENMTFITIDDAGHFTPYFQLDVTRKMVDIFTTDRNWDPYRNTTNVSTSMCNYMKNCNGNGACSPSGMCTCNQGWFLADCSLQPQAFNPSSNSFTLSPRGFAYLTFDLSKGDQTITLQGQNASVLDVFYSYDRVVTYAGEAEGTLSSGAQSGSDRKIYLSAGGASTIYVTIQNSDYLNSATFTVTLGQGETGTGVSEEETTSSSSTLKELAPALTACGSAFLLLVGSLIVVMTKKSS